MVSPMKWIAFAVLVSLALPPAFAQAQQGGSYAVGSYVVAMEDAKVISGKDTVEEVTRGMALKVRGSRPGGWLWVTHHQNGWIESKHVVPLQTALDYLAAEIAQQPRHAPFYNDRATVLFESGDYVGAVRNYSSAIALAPEFFSLRANRAVAYFELGEFSSAVDDLNEVVVKRPDDAQSYVDRGWAKYHAGLFEEAIADYNQALQLDPGSQQAKVNIAWLKATCPDDKFRNGAEALDMAESICQVTEYKDPFALGTLAAAHAELGNMPAAVENQTKAIEFASYMRKKLYRDRLAFFNAGKPYRLHAPIPTGPTVTPTKIPAAEPVKKEPQPVSETEVKPETKPSAGTQPKSVLTPAKKADETKPDDNPAPSNTADKQSAPQE